MPDDVIRRENRIEIASLNAPTFAGHLIRAVRQCRKRHYQSLVLSFAEALPVFPNAATPLAALLDFCRSSWDLDFDYENASQYLLANVLNPRIIADAGDDVSRAPLNRTWRFSSTSEIGVLTNAIVRSVAGAAICRKGVLNALAWCLYEVFENVRLHAEVPGYVMGQIHPASQHIALCIYDCGPGVYNTLRDSHHPATATDALRLAIQQGVTSGKGMGNGLWGLHDIVASNSGRMTLTSGSGFYGLIDGEPRAADRVPFLSYSNNSMMVDFQIDFDKRIEISNLLGGYGAGDSANVRRLDEPSA